MNLFLGYFLPLILMLLFAVVLFMTDCKVYFWHITTIIFAFIPMVNWVIFGVYIIVFLICIFEDEIDFKYNKVTKFLFNR